MHLKIHRADYFHAIKTQPTSFSPSFQVFASLQSKANHSSKVYVSEQSSHLIVMDNKVTERHINMREETGNICFYHILKTKFGFFLFSELFLSVVGSTGSFFTLPLLQNLLAPGQVPKCSSVIFNRILTNDFE